MIETDTNTEAPSTASVSPLAIQPATENIEEEMDVVSEGTEVATKKVVIVDTEITNMDTNAIELLLGMSIQKI